MSNLSSFASACSTNASVDELQRILASSNANIRRRPLNFKSIGDVKISEEEYLESYGDFDDDEDESYLNALGMMEGDDFEDDDNSEGSQEPDDEAEEEEEEEEEDVGEDEDEEADGGSESHAASDSEHGDEAATDWEQNEDGAEDDDQADDDDENPLRNPLRACAIYDRADAALLLLTDFNARVSFDVLDDCVDLGHSRTLAVLVDFIDVKNMHRLLSTIIQKRLFGMLDVLYEKGFITTYTLQHDDVIPKLYDSYGRHDQETQTAVTFFKWLDAHNLLSPENALLWARMAAFHDDIGALSYLACHVGPPHMHRPNEFNGDRNFSREFDLVMEILSRTSSLACFEFLLARFYPVLEGSGEARHWVADLMDRKYFALRYFHQYHETSSVSLAAQREFVFTRFVEANPWLLCVFESVRPVVWDNYERRRCVLDVLVLNMDMALLERAKAALQRLVDDPVYARAVFPVPLFPSTSDPKSFAYVTPYANDEAALSHIRVVNPQYALDRLTAHAGVNFLSSLYTAKTPEDVEQAGQRFLPYMFNDEMVKDHLAPEFGRHVHSLVAMGQHLFTVEGATVANMPLNDVEVAGENVAEAGADNSAPPPPQQWVLPLNAIQSIGAQLLIEHGRPKLFMPLFASTLLLHPDWTDKRFLQKLWDYADRARHAGSVPMMKAITDGIYFVLEHTLQQVAAQGEGIPRSLRERVAKFAVEDATAWFASTITDSRFHVEMVRFLMRMREQPRLGSPASDAENDGDEDEGDGNEEEDRPPKRKENPLIVQMRTIHKAFKKSMKGARGKRKRPKNTKAKALTFDASKVIQRCRAAVEGLRGVDPSDYVFTLGQDWYTDDLENEEYQMDSGDDESDSSLYGGGCKGTLTDYITDVIAAKPFANWALDAPERLQRLEVFTLLLETAIDTTACLNEKEADPERPWTRVNAEVRQYVQPQDVAQVVIDGDVGFIDLLHRYHLLYPRLVMEEYIGSAENEQHVSDDDVAQGRYEGFDAQCDEVWPLMQAIYATNARYALELIIQEAFECGGPSAVLNLLVVHDVKRQGLLDGRRVCALYGHWALWAFVEDTRRQMRQLLDASQQS
jgi:hypothetical protein